MYFIAYVNDIVYIMYNVRSETMLKYLDLNIRNSVNNNCEWLFSNLSNFQRG
jgi:hypothetical protein